MAGWLGDWLCPLPMRFSKGSKGGPRGAKPSPTVESEPWKIFALNYWPSEYMIRSRLPLWHQYPEKMLHLTIGPQIRWSDPGLSLVNPPPPFMQNGYLIGIGASIWIRQVIWCLLMGDFCMCFLMPSFHKHNRANFIHVTLHVGICFSWYIFHPSSNLLASMWFISRLVAYIQLAVSCLWNEV